MVGLTSGHSVTGLGDLVNAEFLCWVLLVLDQSWDELSLSSMICKYCGSA
jgi:hypothetical protein